VVPEIVPIATVTVTPTISHVLNTQSPASPASTPIRLKEDHVFRPTGSGHGRADSRREPVDLTAAETYEPFGMIQESRTISWKLIAAGVVVAVAIIGTEFRQLAASADRCGRGEAAPTATEPTVPSPPTVAGNAGRVTITTEPGACAS
jgi:hypothetical protein